MNYNVKIYLCQINLQQTALSLPVCITYFLFYLLLLTNSLRLTSGSSALLSPFKLCVNQNALYISIQEVY